MPHPSDDESRSRANTGPGNHHPDQGAAEDSTPENDRDPAAEPESSWAGGVGNTNAAAVNTRAEDNRAEDNRAEDSRARNDPAGDGGAGDDRTEDASTETDSDDRSSTTPTTGPSSPLSYRRLVWRSAPPDTPGQWCVRYLFSNGSYSWWTVPVSKDEGRLYVLGPWAKGSDTPVPAETYPKIDRNGRAEWAGPITEPWEKNGIDLQHCDGCGREWRPTLNMLIRSHLTCCARCWEQVPDGFQQAFVESENPDDCPSPVEVGIRRFLKAKRPTDEGRR